MRGRRTAPAALTALLLAVLAHPGVARAGDGPTTWDADYANKKLTVTVNLAFYGNCAQGDDICNEATRISADKIVASILSDWNGHKYKCWPLTVKINSRVVASAAEMPAGYVPIQVTWVPGAIVRADTTTSGSTTKPGDLSPDDSPTPLTDPSNPGRWPAEGRTSDYTHEFGHILKLDDNYDENQPADPETGLKPAVLVPGQTDDAMFSANPATAHLVSEQMVNTVVERSGKVDTSKVRCNLTLDSGPTNLNLYVAQITGLKVHLYACDYDMPSSDPRRPNKPIHFKGTLSLSGYEIIAGGGSGSFPVEFTAVIPPTGGKVQFDVHSTNGKSLTMSGRLVWDNDGLLHGDGAWEIDGQSTVIFNPPFVADQASDQAPECGQ